jgi:Holliday junction resolvase RusA-like endonuclease
MIFIPIKPFSFNRAWRAVPNRTTGMARNVKSKEYKKYEKDVALFLKPMKGVGFDGLLNVAYIFHLSNPLSDYDNYIKPFQDIISAYYDFNDRQIGTAMCAKVLAKKGEEGVEFMITGDLDELIQAVSRS